MDLPQDALLFLAEAESSTGLAGQKVYADQIARVAEHLLQKQSPD